MKMEVLSVQCHIQEQFGGIGATKVKDWTSPLTAPATATATAAAAAEVNVADVDIVDVDVDADVVDGHPASVLHMRQHQALNTRPRLSSTASASASATATASAAAAAAPAKPPASPMAASFDMLNGGSAVAAYMSNVLQAGPPPTLPASPLQSTSAARFGAIDNLDDVNPAAVQELSQQLQAKLRDAKSQHLDCTEVTLPNNLMSRIAAEIIRMSEREPCGERACTIFIEFESEPNNVRRIASFKVDPETVSIFELYLTLKQDKSGWTSLLPQFLKNLTRSNTIMISPDFTLTKNKLYSPSRGSII